MSKCKAKKKKKKAKEKEVNLRMLFLLTALKKNNTPFDLDNYQFPIWLFFFLCFARFYKVSTLKKINDNEQYQVSFSIFCSAQGFHLFLVHSAQRWAVLSTLSNL